MPKPKFIPRLLSSNEINFIRGKMSVGHATPTELQQVFTHWDLIEMKLDELGMDDFFGTEGWRHFFGVPENE